MDEKIASGAKYEKKIRFFEKNLFE